MVGTHNMYGDVFWLGNHKGRDPMGDRAVTGGIVQEI